MRYTNRRLLTLLYSTSWSVYAAVDNKRVTILVGLDI